MDDDKGSESGSVYIFVRSDENTWTQQQKIVVDDGARGDQFGITLALAEGTSSLLVFLTATTKMEVVDWTLELSTCTIARDLRGRNRAN